jgi:hypothetical protein
MDDLTIKLIASSNRTDEDKIKYTIHELGEEFVKKTFNFWQKDINGYEIHLRRAQWKEIFGYEPEGW